ncbi:MAG: hypothetical protein ABWK00_05220 [Desulfurococcaceae archaeon]
MWAYDELFSCPYVLVLGELVDEPLRGIVAVPALNYRINMLRKGSNWRVVSNVPRQLDDGLTRNACREIAEGMTAVEGGFLVRVARSAMFYGGYGVYLETEDWEPLPAILDVVDNSLASLTLIPGKIASRVARGPLRAWVILGLYLRTGITSFLAEACRDLGTPNRNACEMATSAGTLVIARREERPEEGVEIVVDNNPFRHVLSI